MKSKLLVTSLVVLLLWIGLATQVFAAETNIGSNSDQLALRTRTSTRTRTPTRAAITLTPTRSRTPTSTTSAGSVTGSVLIHSGGCCMGGPVGSTINIDTAFSASSTAGAVTEMRIGHMSCGLSPDLSAVAWEPYATSKIFPYTIIAINWVGYYVDVQYRDAAGNVSPVYCDDISIEGMPATPATGTGTAITPTRTPTLTPSRTPTLPQGT